MTDLRETSSVYREYAENGQFIPVANRENKELQEENARLQERIHALRNEHDNCSDRVTAMVSHKKNVEQELHHTQALMTARKQELETENHMKMVAMREDGRLRQETGKAEKELVELKEKKNIYENNIFKQSKKLEDMKSQMNWDQQALEAWLEESARKDEDNMIINKYSRQDESKVKELTLQIDHMTTEAANKKQMLDQEMLNTVTCQIMLDKAAEAFRQAHHDRQVLIDRWENTINQMEQRDKEMDRLALELADAKQELRERDNQLREKEEFLQRETENNDELDKKIQESDRSAARLRNEYKEAEMARDQFQSELETLKRTVDRTAMDLEQTRATVAQLKRDIGEKNNKLEAARSVREQLEEKLKAATESKLSAEERAARMDEVLQEEEAEHLRIQDDLKQRRDKQFRKAQELAQAKRDEKVLDAEIQGSRAACRNLTGKITKLDEESLKQQEILYTQDFTIQQMERRLNRMQGESSNEEQLVLEAKIKQLTEELEQKTETKIMLEKQLKRLQDDVRRVKRDLELTTTEKGDHQVKIQELELFLDMSKKELAKIINVKQNTMVEENLLKLQIKRIRENLNSKADGVMNQEKHRLKLETAMKERQSEIAVHQEMLMTQLRAAEDERQQVSLELTSRIAKIEMHKKRYEILTVAMAPPEGEEEKSQAYYVIKAAQEKEELQRTGDELDAKIRKAEKELKAMENTLQLVNSQNEQYRRSFGKVGETSDELEDKHQLDEQLHAVMDKYKYKRRQILEIEEDLKGMAGRLDNLGRDTEAYNQMIADKENRKVQLQKELEEQSSKLDRVTKQNAKFAREVRGMSKTKDITSDERDFNVRELRELNKNAMKAFGEVVHEHPDMSQPVNVYFSQANLPPPPTPGSASSSRQSSRQSTPHSSSSSARSTPTASKAKVITVGADFASPREDATRGSPAGSARGSLAGSARGSPAGSTRSGSSSVRSSRR